MRSAADFSTTVRSGARSGRRNVVLYALSRTGEAASEPSRFGFIVSKAVGNAVQRNLVKRRLRAIAAREMPACGTGYDVVFRALAPAAEADWDSLSREAHAALAKACRIAAGKAASVAPGRNDHGRQ